THIRGCANDSSSDGNYDVSVLSTQRVGRAAYVTAAARPSPMGFEQLRPAPYSCAAASPLRGFLVKVRDVTGRAVPHKREKTWTGYWSKVLSLGERNSRGAREQIFCQFLSLQRTPNSVIQAMSPARWPSSIDWIRPSIPRNLEPSSCAQVILIIC